MLKGKFFSVGFKATTRALVTLGFYSVLPALACAAAAPLEMQIWQQQFSTYNYSRLTDYAYDASNPDPAHITIVSNRLTAATPLADSIHSPGWNYAASSYTGPMQLETRTEANWFRVETFAQTAAGDKPLGQALAAALSTITFSPLATGLATFNIDLHGWRQYYGAQLLRLTDLTLGQEVWSYGSSGLGVNGMERFDRLLPAGTTFQQEILWEFTGNGNESSFHLAHDTFLTATSTYELTLFATVESQAPETERVFIEWVTAATVIPEPSTFALAGVGAVALGWRRRKSVH